MGHHDEAYVLGRWATVGASTARIFVTVDYVSIILFYSIVPRGVSVSRSGWGGGICRRGDDDIDDE